MAKRFQCVEVGSNDLDSRPLLQSGLFAVETASQTTIAEFPSAEAARAAGDRAENRRPGSKLLIPGERKAVSV